MEDRGIAGTEKLYGGLVCAGFKPAMIDLRNGWPFAEINTSKENPYGLTSITLTPWFSSMLARILLIDWLLHKTN
jgi:hypothetical protein